jgi:hypothetical protein
MALLPPLALACGTGVAAGLDRFHGGDPLMRWLCWSACAGALAGAVAGLFRRAPAAWALYGAASPFAAALASLAVAEGATFVRERIADRREAACLQAGRVLCSGASFQAACHHRDVRSLRNPDHRACDGTTCTERWTYRGPFRPEQGDSSGGLICSIVERDGNVARVALTEIPQPSP